MSAQSPIKADVAASPMVAFAHTIMAGGAHMNSNLYEEAEWVHEAEMALDCEHYEELHKMAARDIAYVECPKGDLLNDGPDFELWFEQNEADWMHQAATVPPVGEMV